MRVLEHRPPTKAVIGDEDLAVFLAGPIQGASDWQSTGVETIEDIAESYRFYRAVDRNLHLFNPRRSEPAMSGEFNGQKYKEQIFWEQDQLATAARVGSLLFWFEPQNYDLPYSDGREYAKTTKKELSMALGAVLLAKKPIKIAVGIDPNFKSNERYLKSSLERNGILINTSLNDTCQEALALLAC